MGERHGGSGKVRWHRGEGTVAAVGKARRQLEGCKCDQKTYYEKVAILCSIVTSSGKSSQYLC